MNATAIGLILDMVGALVLGFVVPNYQRGYIVSAGNPIGVVGRGTLYEKAAWLGIIVGFALQLMDVL